MDEIKKLFQVKRIFAMILAAAMVITMMPTTANAASISDNAAAQTQEADEASADTTAPDTDGSVVDESLQLDAVGETVWGFTDNRSDSDKTAVYNGEPQEFWRGRYKIVINQDGGYYNELVYCQSFKTVWMEKTGEGNEDKDYTALADGEYPVNAGVYKLVVNPDETTTWNFDFTITPCEPKTQISWKDVTPGTTVKDVKQPETLISSLYFEDDEYNTIYFTTTLEDGSVSGYETPIPGTVSVVVAQVKDAITGQALADTDTLTKDQDYVVDLTLTFKDNAAKIYGTNYKLPGTISKLVTISDLVVPTVVVDLGEKQQVDADGKPVTDADGKPVMEDITELERTYTGEAVTEPDQTKEYTVKIQLNEQETDKDGKPVTDTDGNPVYKTIPVTAENLTTSWYKGYDEYDDSDITDANKLDGAPVEAGDYTYLLTYEGQQGIYAKATAKIHVVVNAVELTIVPKFSEGAKFYPGMTVKQALAQVDYTVLDAEKKPFDANVDRNSFWGVYTSYDKSLPFEPVFGIQVKERTEEIINDDGTSAGTVDIYGDGTGSGYGYLSAGTILQTSQTYRVVFTGQKAVYYGNGTETQKCGINDPVNSFIPSYHVADGTNGDETNDENAVAITLEKGAEAVIDSKLVQSDGKGSSYENPISKVYDGTGLFAKKAEYKIATVTAGGKTIAEKANPAITYTWERQDSMEPATDSEGNPITDKDGNPVMVPAWEEYDYDGSRLSDLVSPVNAGKYRLTISYADGRNNKDERGGYYAQPVEVFYEIQPQDVTIVPDAPENGYSAHAGYTVAQFLNSLYNSVELDLAGELPHKIYKLNENREPDTKEPMNWLLGIVDVTTGEGVYWHPYSIDWCVVQDTDKGQVRLNDSDILESGGKYLLMPDTWGFYDEYGDYYADYDNNYKNYVDAGKDENGEQLVIYNAYGVPINLTAQGTVALDIELDTSKITAKTTKEYDGTPISILEDAKKALTVYKQDDANKTPVTDVLSDIQFVWSNDNTGKRVTETEPVDAGTYRLYAKFTGNASYKAFDSSNFCFDTGLTVTITPRELTVVPSLKEPIAAGYSNPSQYYDWSKTEFKNAAESDKEAFTYNSNTSGFTAVSSRGYRVCDADGQYVSSGSKLKGNTEYTFEFANMNLRGKYAANYTLKYEKVPFTTVRGYSSVVGTTHMLKDSLADVKGIGTHTITANEGIEYQYDVYNDVTGEYEDGNFITLRITLPEEYNDFSEAEAVYANSIERAGGCILYKSYIENYPQAYRFIDVRFNAEDGKEKEKPIEFDIRWEEGYVEHFILDFSDADLLEDLRNAVAPKSISLVKPSKKMVVGGTQQLDVKLTTAQIGDLIHLTYTVDKPEVLCVTENGKVTALAEGDATITIESTRRGENGEYVSTTPAKKTTLKVKVSKVSTPKIKKVDNIQDGQAKIWWTPLDSNDGFRREIYVLEGKTTYTKDDFETKIALMKNGNWEDIFAVAPNYGNTYTDSKAKLSYGWVSGLKPDTEYTIYVRNVSAVRTLECEHGNCKVAESHDGNVKGFKTTKGQVKGLSVGFDEELRYVGFDEDNSLYYYYSIALSQGTTQVAVSGYFTDWINAAGDYDWKTLPLSKDDQKDYVNPKLVYMVGELEVLDSYDYEKEGYVGYRYYSYYDKDNVYHSEYKYYYLNKTTKASIDKKGKLKLNGVGEVDVVVKDSITGRWAYNTIEITATADSIANKNVKMQVGQKIGLGNLLTYKEGKKVLIGDYARKIVVDDALREKISESGCFELSADERYLIAVKAGKLSLTLKDAYVGEDKTATVNLTATALEPVKNLKAATVTDQYFDVEFTHSLNPNEVGYKDNLRYTKGLGFRIKVTDARGTLLRSTYVRAEACDYNPVTKKYSFRVTGLKKKSKYNVSVTAEFGNETSKPTNKPITTTLLPASYISLDKDDINKGVSVYVHSEDEDYTIDMYPFYTGNSYTLEVGGTKFNPGAKAAMTDTLTWTSSNSKVATIKANTGSYSAALKAVGQGKTTIEVKSKVTKAVIARYEIDVYAVGDAYNYEFGYRDFFGEDEYLERDEIMSYALKNGMAPLLK